MELFGYVLILIAAFVVWKIQSTQSAKVFGLCYLLALVGLGVGVYFTRMTPYMMVAGLVVAGFSLLRFVTAEWSKFFAWTGSGLFVASLLVAAIGQFGSPWDGEREEEDRSDREVEPRPVLTDAEMLNQRWSADDEYADWPVAELMLNLCQIAYQPPVEAREELQRRGFESETIESGSMNGYVLKSGENAVILLRGTESTWHDVLQDLIFISSNSGNGQMHAGFRSGYDDSMHRQVRQLLQRFGAKRVWITGHSLGGALSIVCAHDLLVDDDYEIAGVMTFGQPKVVRENMKDFLEPKLAERYVFFVNDMDPVVKAVEPYVHFGHMVHYSDGRIERSKRVPVFASNPDEPESEQPKEVVIQPELESFSEKELADYIQRLQDAKKPVTTSDGRPVYQGLLPDVSDHYLDSYRIMIEFLIGEEASPSQQ